MSEPTLPGHGRFVHEAAIYGSDDEFLAVVVPFVAAGIAAGEPTLLRVNRRQERMVLDMLPDESPLVLLAAEHGAYTRPFAALRPYRDLFVDHMLAGASRVRVVGEVPHPGTGGVWDGWARYEAVINHLYAPFAVWGLCPYDRRRTPRHVLADVERTHARFATPDGRHRVNAAYTDPLDFLSARALAEVDPLEAAPPAVALRDPTSGDARQHVGGLAAAAGLGADTVHRLELAVSEAVTNAILHGRPPVDVRAWAAGSRVVVAVRDRGTGPGDPYAGYLPGISGGAGGYGMWIMNQAIARASFTTGPDGFTVRLVAGTPHQADPLLSGR
ncbi:MAG TPA: anti-sigma factor RsbA family regulatory protein [Acidimicrobiales bacterium]|nr:anti-sigma factor RsbA family regulatory protein [Acidimicrobiales bacterium]